MAQNTHVGIQWGELTLTNSFTHFLTGLTGNRYAYVRPHPSNVGNIFLKSNDLGGVGNGYLMAKTDAPIKLDTRFDNGQYLAKGSVNGCTVYWLGCGSEGE